MSITDSVEQEEAVKSPDQLAAHDLPSAEMRMPFGQMMGKYTLDTSMKCHSKIEYYITWRNFPCSVRKGNRTLLPNVK